jgi:alpha-mannosidase
MKDDEDPWGMRVKSFRKLAGRFKLMSRTEGTAFSGVSQDILPSVRVIEDGDVRTVVEAVMRYGDSFICQHYKLPKRGTEIEVQTRVHWNEKDKMLKLSIPTRCRGAAYIGQTAYGIADLPADGNEAVAQKWVAAVDKKANKAVTVINDGIYGSGFANGELRLSLMRSPAFSGHPFWDRLIVVQDRYLPRIDQGERLYRFWFDAGQVRRRLDAVDREALVRNEKPFALSFYPPGQGKKPKAGPSLSDNVVQITAMKYAENGRDIIVRLFEPTGRKRTTTLRLPFVPMNLKVALKGFEIKTLKITPRTKKVAEVNLLER